MKDVRFVKSGFIDGASREAAIHLEQLLHLRAVVINDGGKQAVQADSAWEEQASHDVGGIDSIIGPR
jgi:hypothetical protein